MQGPWKVWHSQKVYKCKITLPYVLCQLVFFDYLHLQSSTIEDAFLFRLIFINPHNSIPLVPIGVALL